MRLCRAWQQGFISHEHDNMTNLHDTANKRHARSQMMDRMQPNSVKVMRGTQDATIVESPIRAQLAQKVYMEA